MTRIVTDIGDIAGEGGKYLRIQDDEQQLEAKNVDLDEIVATEELIPFGNSDSTLTEVGTFRFYCPGDKCVIGIGDFGVGHPFDGTNSLDKGLHVKNSNPSVVLEDTSGAMMTIQAGSGKKFYLKEETAALNDEHFTIDNDDKVQFKTAPRVTVGDGSHAAEIVILGPNGMTDAAVLSAYEGSYQNNGLELTYDSGGNCLYLYDWTGGSKDSTPIMKICRGRDSVRFENLDLIERSSNPSKPPEGETAIWMSDGTGLGGDGDVMIASTVSGTTRYSILFNHSAGTVW